MQIRQRWQRVLSHRDTPKSPTPAQSSSPSPSASSTATATTTTTNGTAISAFSISSASSFSSSIKPAPKNPPMFATKSAPASVTVSGTTATATATATANTVPAKPRKGIFRSLSSRLTAPSLFRSSSGKSRGRFSPKAKGKAPAVDADFSRGPSPDRGAGVGVDVGEGSWRRHRGERELTKANLRQQEIWADWNWGKYRERVGSQGGWSSRSGISPSDVREVRGERSGLA